MSRVGEGDVAIVPQFRGFRSKVIQEVDTTGRSAGSKFSSAFGSVVKGIGVGVAAGVATTIAAVGAIAGKGLSRALNIQDAQAKLRGLGHDAASITGIMNSALGAVKGTAYGLDEAATVAASAVAAGIKPGKELQRYLTLTADAATIAGVSLGDMGAIINKTTTSGKVYTDNLNQLADRGIPIFQWLQDEYKVSAEKLSDMVQSGEVDAATFRKVIEENIGGAALASGTTARGAWANVGAAFSRLGAMFVGSAVNGAPRLFVAIASAVDRLASALQPLADKFSGAVTPAIEGLASWIDRIDFGVIVAKLQAVYVGVKSTIAQIVAAFQTGDFSSLGSTLGTTFGAIGKIAAPLMPIFVAVADAIGKVSGKIGELLAAGIPLLIPILQSFVDILGFLANHAEILTPLIIGLAAGFVVYKTAQAAANVAALASLPLNATRVAATFTLAASQFALAGATRSATAAQLTSNVVQRGGISVLASSTTLWLSQTAAAIGSRIAMLAGAVATGAATAAQWALNAAMSANPIALVVIAIAALVAGLIWFFTQTKLGQQIWSGFMAFLQAAWATITAVFQNAMGLISAGWSRFWDVVSAVGRAIWGGIVLYITTYINLVRAVITAVLSAIRGVWTAVWNGIVAVARSVWSGIQSVISGGINIIRTIIATAMAIIQAIFSGNWSAIGGIVSGAASKIAGIVGGMVRGVQNAIGGIGRAISGVKDAVFNAVAGAGQWLVDSGRAIIQGFIDGITGMIGGIGDAIGGVMDFAKSFFPHSPAKRGPFSGSGWYSIEDSGGAVVAQFGDGVLGQKSKLASKFDSVMKIAGLQGVGSLRSSSSTAADASAAAAGTSGPQVFHLYDQDGTLMGTFRGLLSDVLRPLGAGEVRANMGVG